MATIRLSSELLGAVRKAARKSRQPASRFIEEALQARIDDGQSPKGVANAPAPTPPLEEMDDPFDFFLGIDGPG